MAYVVPNCRKNLTKNDVLFLKKANALQDHDEFNQPSLLLEEDRTLRVLLDSPEIFNVSNNLYFYVVVRHLLKENRVNDPDVADYIASLLCQAIETSHFLNFSNGELHFYSTDVLEKINEAESKEARFDLKAQLGNISLLLTGLFPDYLEGRKERRGAPDLTYYEKIGQTQFSDLSEDSLARQYALQSIFALLAKEFSSAKNALQKMSREVFFFGNPFFAIEKLGI